LHKTLNIENSPAPNAERSNIIQKYDLKVLKREEMLQHFVLRKEQSKQFSIMH